MGDAEALPHAARIAAESLLSRVPKVGLFQQSFDDFLALSAVSEALEHRDVVEHVDRRDPGVHTEGLAGGSRAFFAGRQPA